MIVENKPGGGGVIGQTYGSKAKPDGYTLMSFTSSVVNNPMTKKTTYTHKSFQPIVMFCFDPEILVVPADSKFDTLGELLAYAKEEAIILASPGFSTSHHIAILLLEHFTGVKFDILQFKSSAEQIQQLLGKHIDCSMMSFGEVVGQLEAGSLRGLGTMAEERRSDFPTVPTFKEEGIDILFGPWRGLAVPIDTPKDIVETLAKALEGIVHDQRFVEAMDRAGFPLVYRGPEEFSKYVEQQARNFKLILPLLKIKD